MGKGGSSFTPTKRGGGGREKVLAMPKGSIHSSLNVRYLGLNYAEGAADVFPFLSHGMALSSFYRLPPTTLSTSAETDYRRRDSAA